ncbi:hypothetical protein FHS77_002770 [Paenochrobactrum gallinarii]|uniref:Uncharacterized protein n=1 Tax=Paenochrobactrum gallinarii TaxID=643673 RepID=A0A841M7S5_9HYPH|nr:hypothetical protein [Paenochrobactrum gallinarii]
MSLLWQRIKPAAHKIAVFDMFMVLAIFIYCVAMSHVGRPSHGLPISRICILPCEFMPKRDFVVRVYV